MFIGVDIIIKSPSLRYLFPFSFCLSVHLIKSTYQFNVTIKMSTHEHTEIIHIDFYPHRPLLTQSFNHSYLRSFIASNVLRDVNRFLTVTLDISAFRLGSQMRQENKWRQNILLSTSFHYSRPINVTLRLR